MRSRLVLVLAAAMLATGCGGGADDVPLGERPTLPTDAPALWNPCDGLDLTTVAQLFDARFDLRAGTPTAPECTFTPSDDGGPAIDVNYQLFAGTLDELFATFGTADEGTVVEDVVVPRADGARVVSNVDDGTLAVSGFVKNGDLVQLVNLLDPRPFDRAALIADVEALLGDLAAHADESGLSAGSTTSPSPSPTG